MATWFKDPVTMYVPSSNNHSFFGAGGMFLDVFDVFLHSCPSHVTARTLVFRSSTGATLRGVSVLKHFFVDGLPQPQKKVDLNYPEKLRVRSVTLCKHMQAVYWNA